MGFLPGPCAVSAIEQDKINRGKKSNKDKELDQDTHRLASKVGACPVQAAEKSPLYQSELKSLTDFRASKRT